MNFDLYIVPLHDRFFFRMLRPENRWEGEGEGKGEGEGEGELGEGDGEGKEEGEGEGMLTEISPRNFGQNFPVGFQDVGSKFSCRFSGRNILKKLFYLLGGHYIQSLICKTFVATVQMCEQT